MKVHPAKATAIASSPAGTRRATGLPPISLTCLQMSAPVKGDRIGLSVTTGTDTFPGSSSRPAPGRRPQRAPATAMSTSPTMSAWTLPGG